MLDLNDPNQRIIAGMMDTMLRIQSDWHHKALPNGEYPKTIEELKEAFPDIEKQFDIEIRKSPYAPYREGVMIRLKKEVIEAAKAEALAAQSDRR